jgi:hypothetical protein
MNYLNDLMAGRKAGKDRFPQGLFFNIFNERLNHIEIDVGLQKRYTNFPQGFLNVGFGQFTTRPELFKTGL